ncbi:hypothetical protein [Nocardia concava]|nr:hypothetical protein [Nocardia concava]
MRDFARVLAGVSAQEYAELPPAHRVPQLIDAAADAEKVVGNGFLEIR